MIPLDRAIKLIIHALILAGALGCAWSQEAPAGLPCKPILFQDYDFGTGTFFPMDFGGTQTWGVSTGPVYLSGRRINGFPNVIFDTARNLFYFIRGRSPR